MFSTVMAYLDPKESNEDCLAIAGQLAETVSARVIGISAGEVGQGLYFTAGAAAEKAIEDEHALLVKSFSDLENKFRLAMKMRAKEVEWRSTVGCPNDFVAREARAADIVVVGTRIKGSVADPFTSLDPGALSLALGRPLLLVPRGVQWLDLRRALIAWKETPQCRRAVRDALPLLQKSQEVTVVEVVEDRSDIGSARAHVDDVSTWLRHHGVSATCLVPHAIGGAAQQLERVASDVGAGVVIAGAYGRSQFQELIFGSVTRDLLMRATRCCLLSH